ncbi:uncharacterized protein LOC107613441 isoform X1 [Arachis ipaensis]|uniref:uncharacterized protein LOC107613441 isoform X1 n=1 Tax=Arachis ipaensis TaxID=130454 RepID=UPI000A2B272C|nr:uncharacterized protein LOC107613441 isoform X1 [Arachis ipaensis]XP_020965190.1 uncharacterized protein LOC107613441 isoform X1 [Arachis ipaensis]XP_020965191.1 uncharacterized protein LOC107613441 isoform X1 [Arachis ipaensis]XP_025673379.1 uncharacterized protein LOC112772624 isoform X3 [Arachis hypogaea]
MESRSRREAESCRRAELLLLPRRACRRAILFIFVVATSLPVAVAMGLSPSQLLLRKEGRKNEFERHKLQALNQRQKLVKAGSNMMVMSLLLIGSSITSRAYWVLSSSLISRRVLSKWRTQFLTIIYLKMKSPGDPCERLDLMK